MYDELVKALRNNADHYGFVGENGLVHLLTNAADAIEELQQQVEHYHGCMNDWFEAAQEYKAAVPKWIPVTERLPQQGRRYLVIRFDEVTKTQFIDILWHDAHDLWWNRLYKGNFNVTHWMTLPEPPKEE